MTTHKQFFLRNRFAFTQVIWSGTSRSSRRGGDYPIFLLNTYDLDSQHDEIL